MRLPSARGPLSETLIGALHGAPGRFAVPAPSGDPLTDDDLHLALYLCYELHYRGLDGIDDRWEWEPGLIEFRRALEDYFEAALIETVAPAPAGGDTADRLRAIVDSDTGPSLADFMQTHANLEHFREFLTHRSAYQLKEADPHSWAIPRLWGRAKAALVEIQFDEYGGGKADRIHARLFADSMSALGLDSTYGALIDAIPGVSLATVNLMSFFGLNRRWRGAAVGHLAAFEMSSSIPNRKYANGLRRLGARGATGFFDEHVEADAVHEMVVAHDLAGGLAADDPSVAGDILFGAQALVDLESAFSRHLLDSWAVSRSSLYSAPVLVAPTA